MLDKNEGRTFMIDLICVYELFGIYSTVLLDDTYNVVPTPLTIRN